LAVWVLALGLVGPGSVSADWQNFRGATDGLADNQVLGILEAADGALWFGTPLGASRFDGVHWTTQRDSLPNLTVLSLAEDRTGAFWFGTANGGAVRFDGAHWTTFSSPGVLPSNQVEAILEDHAGDLWFGTPAGLVRYQRGSDHWTTYGTASGLVHLHAWRIVEDHDANLWIATPEGVSRLDSTRTVWQSFQANAEALARDSVLALAVDSTGAVWFGTDQGAFRYAAGAWSRYRYGGGLGDDVVTAILPERSGAVWFGGYYLGLSRFDGRVWRQYPRSSDGALGRILTLHRDRCGNLWVATSASGLYRYDGVAWRNWFSTSTTCPGRLAQSAPFQYVLGGNCVTGMLEDRRGALWFTTADGGAARCDTAGRWTPWRRGAVVRLSDSLAVAMEDRRGRLWFGSPGAGLAVLDSARTAWQAFTRASGLAGDTVCCMLQDLQGDLWFGTDTGVSRYDGAAWRNGLAGVEVLGIAEDPLERLWFRTSDGLYRLDAARTTWRRFGAADGLASDTVTAMLVMREGRVCAGSPLGLSMTDDGDSWTAVTSFGADHDSVVVALCEDHTGRLWVGLDGGAASLDGRSWTHFPRQTFPSTPIMALFEDDLHTLWGATYAGLVRYNGDTWRTYDSSGDGLATDLITGFLEDSQGHLWFASNGGLTEHEPDRVAPQSVLISSPAPLTASQDAEVVFGGGYGESSGLEYSRLVDGGAGSSWSSAVGWSGSGLADGGHLFSVSARDWSHNVDPTPAAYDWEVDATPPAAILSSPVFGQAVRGVLEVRGTAADARFRGYRVEARPVGATAWSLPIDSSAAPSSDTLLARWDTRGVAEGSYDLRLAVLDTLGLVGVGQVTVIVDNEAPWADVTSPARVSALSGGDVYTTLAEVHLYFPPRAFAQDATVSVTEAAPPPSAALPATARAITPGYDIAWSASELHKAATLEFLLPDSLLAGAGGVPVIWAGHGGEGWSQVGGTYDPVAGRIAAAIEGAARYAVVMDTPPAGGEGGIGGLAFTPRVFSPTGDFAARSVAISFTLARSGTTSVAVFNRAGRRVRQLASGLQLNAGANLVRWDGRDDDGRVVEDGLYLVGVEALGQMVKRPVAVVR
jgi:ligand-binding sensor domain-containing protein